MSDTISTIDNRLRGKSVIVAIYRRYIGIGPIYQRNFDCGTHAWGRNLFAQIIGNILSISLIYRWLKNGLVDSFDGLIILQMIQWSRFHLSFQTFQQLV